MIAWDDVSGCCDSTLTAAFRDAGEPFGAPQSIPAGEGRVGRVRVAMNRAGDSVLVYDVETPEGDRLAWEGEPANAISAARGTAVGGFSAPRVVSDPARVSSGPGLAADARGDAILTWTTDNDTTDWARFHSVYAATRAAGGDFGAPLFQAYGASPGAGIADDGRGLITYTDGDVRQYLATIDAVTGSAGAPAVTALGNSFHPHVAVAPDGTAVLAMEGVVVMPPAAVSAPATYGAWGSVVGSFGPWEAIACPPPGYALSTVTLAGASRASALLVEPGSDATALDDRLALARSDPGTAPDAAACGWRPVNLTPAPVPAPDWSAAQQHPPGAPSPSTASAHTASARPGLRLVAPARVRLRGRRTLMFALRGAAAAPVAVSARIRRGAHAVVVPSPSRASARPLRTVRLRLPIAALRLVRARGGARLVIRVSARTATATRTIRLLR